MPRFVTVLGLVMSAGIMAGCQQAGQYGEKFPSKGQRGGSTGSSHGPRSVGSSCSEGSGSDRICLGVKLVTYQDSMGQPVINSSEAAANQRGINQVWNQCNIGFQIEDYQAVDPNTYGLRYNTAENFELDGIRRNFNDDSNLLVVVTGAWDRTGSLGATGANAWTAMPGESLLGVVLESSVGTFANIIAHELGHYLGLGHESDASDLMNPIIYDSSTTLSQYQCSSARSTAMSYWQRMIR